MARRSERSEGQRLRRLLARERELWAEGYRAVAGVDEAGVGPLAGPLVAAAVVFAPEVRVRGVDDSKKLTPGRRAELQASIRAAALSWSVARVEPDEIDRLNVYQAGLLAMRRAVEGLSPGPDFVLVDARRIPELPLPQEPLIGGDARCHAIAAASILAKTCRDELMRAYESEYPGYGFATHKGYPTVEHRDAIRRLGATPIHRRSFTLLPQPRLFD